MTNGKLRWFGVVALTLSGLLWGCESQHDPNVSVSDFGVYTSLNLIAVDAKQNLAATTKQSGPAQPLLGADMSRYFESTSPEYASSKRRMDEFLDGMQRRSAFVQDLQTSLVLNLAINLTSASAQAATQPSTTQMATATTQAIDELNRYSQDTTQPILDSPFDTLDRVSDFYTAYLLKSLRVTGDARSISPKLLAKYILLAMENSPKIDKRVVAALGNDVGAIITSSTPENPVVEFPGQPSATQPTILPASATQPTAVPVAPLTQDDSQQDRLLLFLFQSHIEPGDKADSMAGVRIHIVSAAGGPSGVTYSPDSIKIVALHPTRSYDIDSASFNQSEQKTLSMAASLSGSVHGVGIAGYGGDASTQANQERESYLSRISKEASFADAAQHTYGFDFYPSNVTVTRRNPIDAFFSGKTFRAEGCLEPGAHDCAFLALVPRHLQSFTCTITYLTGAVAGTEENLFPSRGRHCFYLNKKGIPVVLSDPSELPDNTDCEEFTVTLPAYDTLESLASTVGAAPVILSSTTQPTTQP